MNRETISERLEEAEGPALKQLSYREEKQSRYEVGSVRLSEK